MPAMFFFFGDWKFFQSSLLSNLFLGMKNLLIVPLILPAIFEIPAWM